MDQTPSKGGGVNTTYLTKNDNGTATKSHPVDIDNGVNGSSSKGGAVALGLWGHDWLVPIIRNQVTAYSDMQSRCPEVGIGLLRG